MEAWKMLIWKLAFFVVAVPILGFALLHTVEFIQVSWKSNDRRKKWLAMCAIAGIYLITRGLYLS
ncbi:MAG: hypothetical protein RL235_149 [Chlamydiota bacterium]|jgi:hypothetical protein